MSGEPISLLIDTNVWLDVLIPSRLGHATAIDLLRTAIAHDCQLLYPVRILADVYYMVRHEAKECLRTSKGTLSEADARACNDHAWDCIENIRELACAVGADESDVWLAVKHRGLHSDLEDDFVFAAAQRARPTYLISSDKTLVRKAPVAALMPDDALALLHAVHEQ